ncbi:unnamed protein product [Orchesella dallaii]|uniref:Uncharacterized protein n=1 Tax=Orchesella dallaii TaxID=48710 RepID=A0ABP1RLZ4_9HEXA
MKGHLLDSLPVVRSDGTSARNPVANQGNGSANIPRSRRSPPTGVTNQKGASGSGLTSSQVSTSSSNTGTPGQVQQGDGSSQRTPPKTDSFIVCVGTSCSNTDHLLDVSVEVLHQEASNIPEEGEGLVATPDDLLPWLHLNPAQVEFCIRCLETPVAIFGEKIVIVLHHHHTSAAPLLGVHYRFWIAQHVIRREGFGCEYPFRARIYTDMQMVYFGGLQMLVREMNQWALKPSPMSDMEQRNSRIPTWKVNPLARSIGGFSSRGFRFYRDPVYLLPPLALQALDDLEFY